MMKLKTILCLSLFLKSILCIFRIDREETRLFNKVSYKQKEYLIGYQPYADKWYLPHTHGVFHVYKGKETLLSGFSEVVKIKIPRLKEETEVLSTVQPFLRNQKDHLLIGYLDKTKKKNLLITEIQGFNVVTLADLEFPYISYNSIFVDYSSNYVYSIGKTPIVPTPIPPLLDYKSNKLVRFNMNTMSFEDNLWSFGESISTMIQVSGDNILACEFLKNCYLISMISHTTVKNIQLKSEAQVDPTKFTKAIFSLLDYEKTWTGAKNTALLGVWDGDAETNLMEIVDYKIGSTVANIVLTSGIVEAPFSELLGIPGSPFCIIKEYNTQILLVNPIEQTSDEPLNVHRKLNFVDAGILLYKVGIKAERGLPFFYTIGTVASSTNAFSLKPSTPVAMRISLCGGLGCNRCTTDLSSCMECAPGVPLFTDPVHQDKFCLAACKNKIIERVSWPNKRCVNCLTEASADKEACYFSQPFYLREVKNEALKNQSYSHSFEITFSNSTTTLSHIKEYINLQPILDVELEGIAMKNYNFWMGKRANSLIIDLNFTNEMPPDQEIKLKVKNKNNVNIVHMNSFTERADLLFQDSDTYLNFLPVKKVSEEAKKTVEDTSKVMSVASSIVGSAGLGVGIVTILMNLPVMSFIIKFIFIMKILNRLKLLNVEYGQILDPFLSKIFNLFEVTVPRLDDETIRFDSKTRGKLTVYNYGVLSLFGAMDKFIIYILLFLLDRIRLKIWGYAKSLNNMLSGDRLFCNLVEKFRFLFLTATIQDLLLLGLNELAHHDVTIKQDSMSLLSYFLVVICLIIVSYDICSLFYLAIRLRTTYLNRMNSKTEKVDPFNMSLLFRKNYTSGARSSIASLKRSNLGMPSFPESGPKLQKQLLPKNKSKPASKDVPFLTSIEYMKDGIKPELRHTFSGAYFNGIYFLRLLIFEPLFVTLQMLPTLQVFSVFMIQTLFLIFTYRAVFKAKIFKNHYISFNFILNETFIFLFLIVAMFAGFGGSRKISQNSWETIQKVTVVMIVTTCILNLVIFILALVGLVKMIKKIKKLETSSISFIHKGRKTIGSRSTAFPQSSTFQHQNLAKMGKIPKKNKVLNMNAKKPKVKKHKVVALHQSLLLPGTQEQTNKNPYIKPHLPKINRNKTVYENSSRNNIFVFGGGQVRKEPKAQNIVKKKSLKKKFFKGKKDALKRRMSSQKPQSGKKVLRSLTNKNLTEMDEHRKSKEGERFDLI